LIAPSLIVDFRSLCRKLPPRNLEMHARAIKRRRGAAALLAGVRARIEAAEPLSRVLVMRLAYAARDGADLNVTVVDVPAILAFGIAVAGEFGHGALKRGRTAIGKPLRLAVDNRDNPKGGDNTDPSPVFPVG
jgi:hypothetical protein